MFDLKHLVRGAGRLALVGLALAAASSAQAASAAKVQVVTMQNGASQPVTRTVPGYNLTGTYTYPDNSEAMVVLNAGGSGLWRGDTGEAANPITWWIAADPAGNALTVIGPGGQAHTLIVDMGGKLSGFELVIGKSSRQMWINRERMKPY